MRPPPPPKKTDYIRGDIEAFEWGNRRDPLAAVETSHFDREGKRHPTTLPPPQGFPKRLQNYFPKVQNRPPRERRKQINRKQKPPRARARTRKVEARPQPSEPTGRQQGTPPTTSEESGSNEEEMPDRPLTGTSWRNPIQPDKDSQQNENEQPKRDKRTRRKDLEKGTSNTHSWSKPPTQPTDTKEAPKIAEKRERLKDGENRNYPAGATLPYRWERRGQLSYSKFSRNDTPNWGRYNTPRHLQNKVDMNDSKDPELMAKAMSMPGDLRCCWRCHRAGHGCEGCFAVGIPNCSVDNCHQPATHSTIMHWLAKIWMVRKDVQWFHLEEIQKDTSTFDGPQITEFIPGENKLRTTSPPESKRHEEPK